MMSWFVEWIKHMWGSNAQPRGIFYIGGSDILPTPLEPEEEREWLGKLAGEGEEKEEAKQVLIERNLRLVVYIAKKFDNTFNPDKKIKLATYASRCIENEILMYLRRNNRIKTEVSIDEPLNVDWDGNELLLSDILGSDQDVISRRMEDEIDKELLLKSLEILNQRERAIVELRFGLKSGGREKTQKEVADLLGISQSYISRLEKKIMKRLQKEIIRML